MSVPSPSDMLILHSRDKERMNMFHRLHSPRPLFLAWCLLAAIATTLVSAPAGQAEAAESPDKMIQQAKSELRAAESLMHNGKREEAAKGVQGVAELLFRVREADPDNSKLSLLIGKTEKLRDTLQKRMETTIRLKTDPEDESSAEEGTLPEDAETLGLMASELLRLAESDMHNGRNSDASEKLTQAEPVIAKLREVDPEYRRLMALETALKSQTQTVNKRLDAAGPDKAPAAATESSNSSAAPASPAAKLPYHTRNIVRDAEQNLASAERAFGELADEDSNFTDATLHQRIEDRIGAIEGMLPGLQDQAATDNVSDDPRVTGVETHLADLRTRLAESRAASAASEAVAAEAQGKIDTDVTALRATFDRLQDPYFNKCTGTPIYYNDLDPPRETLALIEKFEKEELATTQAQLDGFTAKYGSTREEVKANTGDPQAGYPLEGIRDGIINMAKTREAMAEDLVKRANEVIEGLSSLHDLYRMSGHDRARDYLTLAEGYSPDNASVQSLRATLEQTLEEDLKAYVERIDDRTWPGTTNSSDAKAAMKFFQEDIGWGQRQKNPEAEDKEPRRPIGISVTGDWSVQARNLLGNPTMYGLPVFVAVQLDREKELGLARVYNVTMRTAESANAAMKPPFTSITVGDSWYIKAAKVK